MHVVWAGILHGSSWFKRPIPMQESLSTRHILDHRTWTLLEMRPELLSTKCWAAKVVEKDCKRINPSRCIECGNSTATFSEGAGSEDLCLAIDCDNAISCENKVRINLTNHHNKLYSGHLYHQESSSRLRVSTWVFGNSMWKCSRSRVWPVFHLFWIVPWWKG